MTRIGLVREPVGNDPCRVVSVLVQGGSSSQPRQRRMHSQGGQYRSARFTAQAHGESGTSTLIYLFRAYW